jgi:hypothetical protein
VLLGSKSPFHSVSFSPENLCFPGCLVPMKGVLKVTFKSSNGVS